MWCIPRITDEFKAKMLDVLDVYQRPYDPNNPVICLDEKSKQLIKTQSKLASSDGYKIKRKDYEYERCGTVNLFVAVEPKAGKRTVRVTKRRTCLDFSSFMSFLVLDKYAACDKITLVTDNLNIHSLQALEKSLPKEEVEKIKYKIEWHYTPKHASWLDQAEIEISALDRQLLSKKDISNFQDMQKEVAALVAMRNNKKIKIDWKFTSDQARIKFRLDTQ